MPLWLLEGIFHCNRTRRQERERAIKKAVLSAAVALVRYAADRAVRVDCKVRHYVTVSELPCPEQSPWAEVKNAGTDNGFLEMTSLTYGAFRFLHQAFDPALSETSTPVIRCDRRPWPSLYSQQKKPVTRLILLK